MLAVYSRLTISARDRAWIDAVRQAHDPQYALIEPHVSFVFPFDGIAADTVLPHLRAVAAATRKISFRLADTAAVPDELAPRSHVFLLPSEGEEVMRLLHMRLHEGPLAANLHPTIRFRPHVTVAAFARHEDAEAVANGIGAIHIAGTLDALHLAALDGARVTDLHRFPFA